MDIGRHHPTVGRYALALLVVLVSCGSGQRDEDRGATSETAPTAPATTTTLTAPSEAIRGGCPTGVGAGPLDGAQAARCLAQAWKEAKRSNAEAVASIDVVDGLFRDRWSPPDGALRPCAPETGAEGMACPYAYHGATYVFGVRPSEGGWRVVQLRKVP